MFLWNSTNHIFNHHSSSSSFYFMISCEWHSCIHIFLSTVRISFKNDMFLDAWETNNRCHCDGADFYLHEYMEFACGALKLNCDWSHHKWSNPINLISKLSFGSFFIFLSFFIWFQELEPAFRNIISIKPTKCRNDILKTSSRILLVYILQTRKEWFYLTLIAFLSFYSKKVKDDKNADFDFVYFIKHQTNYWRN